MEVRHALSTKRRTRRIKFRAVERTVQSSVVKVRGCGIKDLKGKEKNLLGQTATEQEVRGKSYRKADEIRPTAKG